MAIDTAEKRRSVIDFGKGVRGTGMPIPSGSVSIAARTHLMNLYPGITPVVSAFFFWRNRFTAVSEWLGRSSASDSGWRSGQLPSGAGWGKDKGIND